MDERRILNVFKPVLQGIIVASRVFNFLQRIVRFCALSGCCKVCGGLSAVLNISSAGKRGNMPGCRSFDLINLRLCDKRVINLNLPFSTVGQRGACIVNESDIRISVCIRDNISSLIRLCGAVSSCGHEPDTSKIRNSRHSFIPPL